MTSNGRSQQVKSLTYSRKGNRDNAMERRRQFTPRKRASESEDDGICDLCVQKIKIYAIGYCDHPICYRCSGKMRVLCEQVDCAVCRVNMKKIIYSKSRRTFNEANSMHLIHHAKNNAWFTDEVVKMEYEKLFEHRCSICPNGHLETSFEKLEAHMRKEHKQFYCNLCVRFNTNFTDECKMYTRELLARHRRVGDDDDSSHKGHPLCEFCDERYLDKDVLLQHLRKDHYFCHFCDKDGKNQYYDGYVDLRQHYQQGHFLCEEGDCINEQFTSVFATKLDLQAHRTAAHMGNLTRQQQKVERNIDLGFQYPKPTRGGRGRRDGDFAGSSNERNGGRVNGSAGKSGRDEDLELAKAISLSEQEKKKGESFKKVDSRPRVQREQPKQQPPREPTPPPDLVADFPTLGASGNDQQLNDPYHYSSVRKTLQSAEEKTEINQQYGPTAADRLAAAAGRSVGKISQEDFPTLGLSDTNRHTSSGLWAQSVGSTTKAKNIVAKSSNRSVLPISSNSRVNLKNKDDFPTLGGRPPPPISITQPPPLQPKKPVSVNMRQTKFTKSNVDLKNNDEFPTLGGKSATPAQGNIWGPGVLVGATSKKKSKKPKTPLSSQETPRPKQHTTPVKSAPVEKSNPVSQMPSSLHREYDPLSHNDSVAVRIGSHKHTVRLVSTDYSAALEGVEKPVEVAGLGGNSVNTVSAEAFSMLSKSSGMPWRQQQTGQSKFDAQGSDFPGLPTGRAGRIKGISSSSGFCSQEARAKPSLSNLSKDLITKSKIDEPSNNSSKYNEYFESDMIKPPTLSSYVADWYEEQQPSTSAVEKTKDSTFQAEVGDFPSLSVDVKKNQQSGKKNKKKRKKGATVNDVSKHFGTDSVEQNTGHLENLLKSQTIEDSSSISELLDKGGMFSRNEEWSSSNISTKNDERNDRHAQADVTQYGDHASGIMLLPRPQQDNIEGRNVWLINTVQQLCGTDENFVEFKISSGKFRQGSLSAESYYEKCRILLGKEHFEPVFMELVDLLPDLEKRQELMSAHRQG